MRDLVIKPGLTDNDHQINATTLQSHIDDDYYVVDLYPKDFSLSGSGTTPSTAATLVSLPVGNERIDVIQFTNGNTDEVKASIRSRRLWESGNFEFNVYFTGSTSNTNNLRWSLRGYRHALDEDITAASTLSTDETVAGPATLLFLKKYTFTSYLSFSRQYELINLSLSRASAHANDTYTGDAYLVMMKIRLIPSNIQSGLKA